MIDLVCLLLRFFLYFMLAWIILSYVAAYGRLPWGHPIRKVYDFANKVMDPLLRPIRGMLRPVRIGGIGLDLSPLVIWIGVLLIIRLLGC